MKDQIESYASRDNEVVELLKTGAVVRSNAPVRVDHAVRFSLGEESAWGRVTRTLGQGRFEVQLFEQVDWLEDEPQLEIFEEPPSLILPWDVGPIESADLKLAAPKDGPPWPPRPVAMMELSGARTVLPTGLESIDVLAPLVQGGFNLVIDANRDRAAFDALVAATGKTVDIDVRVDAEQTATDVRRRLHAGGNVDEYEKVMAAALAWIADARHDGRSEIFAVMELPVVVAEFSADAAPSGLGSASKIADAVASTKQCDVTCVMRLPAATGPDGFADIVESLALGEVDAQIFLDGKGRFEPDRSSSSAPIDAESQRLRTAALANLHRAARAADRLSLWGEDDLEEEEREALEASDAMRVTLVSD